MLPSPAAASGAGLAASKSPPQPAKLTAFKPPPAALPPAVRPSREAVAAAKQQQEEDAAAREWAEAEAVARRVAAEVEVLEAHGGRDVTVLSGRDVTVLARRESCGRDHEARGRSHGREEDGAAEHGLPLWRL